MPRATGLLVGAVALLVGCGPGPTAPDGIEAVDGVEVAEGWAVELVADDFVGPTQVAVTPGGRVLVAHLDGDEGDGTGTVVDLGLDGQGGTRSVVVDGLDKPTGLAVVGEDVLVQTPDALLRYRSGAQVPEELVAGLPNNGRSQGTLTLLPDGRLAFEASGTGSGPDPDPRSGVLYAVDPAAEPGTEPAVVAVGFKGPYAHALDAAENLYVTEIGDGTYDGERPPDELNVIPAGVWRAAVAGEGEPYDGGWPDCTGEGDPTEEFGVTAAECAELPAPLATFPPGATPTSVAVTVDGTVLVALWVEGRVVQVDPDDGTSTDVVTGLDGPQHLLAHEDGSVLLTVHGSGQLLRLVAP